MSLPSRPPVPAVRRLPTIVWAAGLGALLAFVSVRTASAASAAQTFPGSGAVEAWPVLVPMLAASASLERAIEVFWNLVEWFLLRVGGWQAADLKRPDYTQLKSGLSLIMAGVLGVAITGYTDIRLLSYLQPQANGILDQVPVAWDVLLSGILLGTGTKPVHDSGGHAHAREDAGRQPGTEAAGTGRSVCGRRKLPHARGRTARNAFHGRPSSPPGAPPSRTWQPHPSRPGRTGG